MCSQKISRGGTNSRTYGTTNLVQHLRNKHGERYKLFQQTIEEQKAAPSAKVTTPLRQISLKESEDRVRVWDINDARAKRIHKRIGEMIALDSQPFSVVEDKGFRQLIKELEPHLSPQRGYFHLLEMFMMRREIDWHQKEPRPFSSLRVTTMFLDTSADVDLSVYVHSFSYCIL